MKKVVKFNSNFISDTILPTLEDAIKSIEEAYSLISINDIPNQFLYKNKLIEQKNNLYLYKNELIQKRTHFQKMNRQIQQLNDVMLEDINQLSYFRIIEKK